jgi:hypothetical protein
MALVGYKGVTPVLPLGLLAPQNTWFLPRTRPSNGRTNREAGKLHSRLSIYFFFLLLGPFV